jgi:hypothetical protein
MKAVCTYDDSEIAVAISQIGDADAKSPMQH